MDTVTAKPEAPRPSSAELFTGFLEVALNGFGGAAAWARQVLVVRRRWLTDAEFTESLGMSQVIPGPNVINLAVYLGDRYRGWRGALAAFAGVMAVPTLLAVAIDAVLMRWVHIAPVHRALVGLGAGAAGLVWAMGLQLAKPLRRSLPMLLIAALAFVAAGPLKWPLPWVVLALVPASVWRAWRRA
ncbi:MAG: chromate transporter [Deltaproteobacteria bacterium]|nr:chromate transporter [Deltaproteobacteria bacterium]